ncbi:hypothetical protein NPIL_569981 [Nephila pilipes]|uniref:Uncharacterized protein n=1 Tax=Nephila pilipes TaxID=299642 RepID=A0A8X6Q0A6_NEPPI|nr:hypothetical protein NPIL_569981 [Nephila pilipes]
MRSSGAQLGIADTHSSSAGFINHPIKNAKCGPEAIRHDHVITVYLRWELEILGVSEGSLLLVGQWGSRNKCVLVESSLI